LCTDALRSRPAVIVSGARPADERAWLMSARTWATGEAPAASVADVAGDDDAGQTGAEEAGDGRAEGRFARADGRFVRAGDDGGTLATATWKGRPAQDPADELD